MAGAAAALTGSAFVATSQPQGATTSCDDNTVVGMLQGISKKIANIESVIGSVEAKAPPAKRAGIDIVLGAQWGDEGKGKLVDILSQVGEDTVDFERTCTSLINGPGLTDNVYLLFD